MVISIIRQEVRGVYSGLLLYDGRGVTNIVELENYLEYSSYRLLGCDTAYLEGQKMKHIVRNIGSYQPH
jgi:hypothetical protein